MNFNLEYLYPYPFNSFDVNLAMSTSFFRSIRSRFLLVTDIAQSKLQGSPRAYLFTESL